MDLLPNWLLSCRLENFGPNFIIVYPIDSFQDHLTQFHHCVPYSLLSRPFDLIFGLLLERPYLIKGKKFMIFCMWFMMDFAAEIHSFCENRRFQELWAGLTGQNPRFSWKPQISSWKTMDFELKTVDFGQKTADFGQKRADFAGFEFKTRKLIISFQSRERIQRLSMFFSFFLFFGQRGVYICRFDNKMCVLKVKLVNLF